MLTVQDDHLFMDIFYLTTTPKSTAKISITQNGKVINGKVLGENLSIKALNTPSTHDGFNYTYIIIVVVVLLFGGFTAFFFIRKSRT